MISHGARSQTVRPSLIAFVVGACAACVVASSRAGTPRAGILQSAGGGVRIASVTAGVSTECLFAISRTLTCVVRDRDGHIHDGFRASMNQDRVVFAPRSTRPLTVAQPPGTPVYGAYRTDPDPRLIRLDESASIGFLGTNIACQAARDGSTPGLRCLSHAGPGLPGPCCGPSFGLLVGSYGFYLSPRRLQELLVTGTGVTTGSHPPRAPYRIVREWRR